MPVRVLAALPSLLAALFIVGCSEQPWVQTASPDQIVLRWYPTNPDLPDTGDTAAQFKAQAHCAQTGRRAVLFSIERTGSVQRATFFCR
ncbi:MAG: hypothetical protein AB7H90_21140 [Alphaproteobacteria bacterium]